jgi:hypothetical protein
MEGTSTDYEEGKKDQMAKWVDQQRYKVHFNKDVKHHRKM